MNFLRQSFQKLRVLQTHRWTDVSKCFTTAAFAGGNEITETWETLNITDDGYEISQHVTT